MVFIVYKLSLKILGVSELFSCFPFNVNCFLFRFRYKEQNEDVLNGVNLSNSIEKKLSYVSITQITTV